MASINKHGKGQWQANIRKKDYKTISKTLPTKKSENEIKYKLKLTMPNIHQRIIINPINQLNHLVCFSIIKHTQ